LLKIRSLIFAKAFRTLTWKKDRDLGLWRGFSRISRKQDWQTEGGLIFQKMIGAVSVPSALVVIGWQRPTGDPSIAACLIDAAVRVDVAHVRENEPKINN
jgi:hypothetical protein